jgi:outer membrane protein assembly factor BamB
MAKLQRLFGIGMGLGLSGLLIACAPDVVLQGERFDTRADLGASIPTEDNPSPTAAATQPINRSVAIALPAAQTLASWPQRGGSVRHDSPHASFSAAPALVWSVNLGVANSRQNRIVAAPVVADGRVFALDAQSGLVAVSTAGVLLWKTDLTPDFDQNSALSGGGLSVDGATVYATTGYGEVVALETATGLVLWRQRLGSVPSSAPLASGGAVYVSSRDGSVWAMASEDGRVLWTDNSNQSMASLSGAAAPAIGDGRVYIPVGAGDLLAFDTQGTPVWSASISGERAGRAYAGLGGITGDPVLMGGLIYMGTASGKTAALDAETGSRIWTAPQGALNPPLVVGGSVFVVNDEAMLVRLDAGSGEEIWQAEMPYFVKDEPKKRKGVFAHYGPVLAGGRLAVASGDGFLRLFNATDGTMVATAEIPGGAAAAPAMAQGLMFVVTAKGQLLAFR